MVKKRKGADERRVVVLFGKEWNPQIIAARGRNQKEELNTYVLEVYGDHREERKTWVRLREPPVQRQ